MARADRAASRPGGGGRRGEHPDPALLRAPRPARRRPGAPAATGSTRGGQDVQGHQGRPAARVHPGGGPRAARARRTGTATGRRRPAARAQEKLVEVEERIADLVAIRDTDRGPGRRLRRPAGLRIRGVLPHPVRDHHHAPRQRTWRWPDQRPCADRHLVGGAAAACAVCCAAPSSGSSASPGSPRPRSRSRSPGGVRGRRRRRHCAALAGAPFAGAPAVCVVPPADAGAVPVELGPTRTSDPA